MSTGKYIVIEGVDYSGKSTMTDHLAQYLIKRGVDVIKTRHPGATHVGHEIRKAIKNSDIELDPLTEALLFAADNSAFVNQKLQPALEAGKWVLADRNNFVSSLAYQTTSGCSLEELDKVHSFLEDPPKIDLLIILRITMDKLLERKKLRGSGPDRYENEDYFESVRSAYDQLIDGSNPEFDKRLEKFVTKTTTTPEQFPRCVGIDSNRTQKEVFESIKQLIDVML